MPGTSHLGTALLISALCWFIPGSVAGQGYPSGPIRLIVPNTPGTNLDTVARIMAPQMSKFLSQPVIVENKPGANSTIGLEYVARQMPADGYTMVVALVSELATLPLVVKDLRFDALKDLPPIMDLVESRLFFGSSSKMPWRNFGELVAHAKANPGKLNYGASVSTVRLLTEALLRGAGITVTYVPYAASAAYVQAILAADIQLAFIGESAGTSFGDKFRVLAVTGDKPAPGFPDVPTFAQLGYPQIRGITNSLNVRAGTPKVAIEKLYAAGSSALRQPEVRALFAKSRYAIVEQAQEAAARRLAEEGKLFADVAKQIGIQPQ